MTRPSSPLVQGAAALLLLLLLGAPAVSSAAKKTTREAKRLQQFELEEEDQVRLEPTVSVRAPLPTGGGASLAAGPRTVPLCYRTSSRRSRQPTVTSAVDETTKAIFFIPPPDFLSSDRLVTATLPLVTQPWVPSVRALHWAGCHSAEGQRGKLNDPIFQLNLYTFEVQNGITQVVAGTNGLKLKAGKCYFLRP